MENNDLYLRPEKGGEVKVANHLTCRNPIEERVNELENKIMLLESQLLSLQSFINHLDVKIEDLKKLK